MDRPSLWVNAVAWVHLRPVELLAWGSKDVGEEALGISTGRWGRLYQPCILLGASELTGTDIERLRVLPKKVAKVPRCGTGPTIALLLELVALVMDVPGEVAVESPESPDICLLVTGGEDSYPAFDGVPERDVCLDEGL